ncbi:MAG: FKBP-type peptidyl-prolyl cis-trans isomerase [Bacteroidota bacterium]|nr:FKBP-type peptidyl-prolyl cis-trans isomerase [Bacteroidota bacterium]
MKKLFFIVVASSLICFFGCGKQVSDNVGCTNRPVFSDSSMLLKYAADSSIHATMDSTGLFYQIIDSGNTKKPVFSSTIVVNYVGRFMSGTLFDSASNSNLNGATLSGLITGWQIGLPKIGVGGRIKLLIPSAFAWGCTGYGPVPHDAPVYFDVQLLQVY